MKTILITLILTTLRAFAGPSAYDTYGQIHYQAFTHESIPLKVVDGYIKGNKGIVSFGAEKEGGDYRISNVMSPNVKLFKKYINTMGPNEKISFLRTFLRGIIYEDFALKSVKDREGIEHAIDYSQFNNPDVDKLSTDKLYELLKQWLDLTQDSPFSFINPNVRKKIYKGQLIENMQFNKKALVKVLYDKYADWVPQLGMAQKYIMDALPRMDFIIIHYGWEIRFNPMESVGDYYAQLDWIFDNLGEYPGHHRIVYAEKKFDRESLTREEDKKKYKRKISELYRMIQSYSVFQSLRGKTGAMNARYKKIITDKEIKALESWKGVIRPENHRWDNYSQSIEFRNNTKDFLRFTYLENILTASAVSTDFSHLQSIDSWNLVPGKLTYLLSNAKFAKRFNLSSSVVSRFFNIVEKVKPPKSGEDAQKAKQTTDVMHLLPLWKWEQAPFLTPMKKEMIKNLTREFIIQVVKNPSLNYMQMKQMLSDWATQSCLSKDIENYINPRPTQVPENREMQHEIGIEVSADLPMLKMNEDQKISVMKSYAHALQKRIGSRSDIHCNGNDLECIFTDLNGLEWNVTLKNKVYIKTPITKINYKMISSIFESAKEVGVYLTSNRGFHRLQFHLPENSPRALFVPFSKALLASFSHVKWTSKYLNKNLDIHFMALGDNAQETYYSILAMDGLLTLQEKNEFARHEPLNYLEYFKQGMDADKSKAKELMSQVRKMAYTLSLPEDIIMGMTAKRMLMAKGKLQGEKFLENYTSLTKFNPPK